MDIEERKSRIEELKRRYPEFRRMYSWYTICKAAELCVEDNVNDKMDDSLTSLLEKTEGELISNLFK